MGHILRTFPISGLGLGFPSCWSWSAVCRATSILSCPCASRCPPYAISSSHEIFFRILGRLILENLSWWWRLSIWHLASFAYEQSTYLPPWQSSSGAKWLATKLYLSWKSFVYLKSGTLEFSKCWGFPSSPCCDFPSRCCFGVACIGTAAHLPSWWSPLMTALGSQVSKTVDLP